MGSFKTMVFKGLTGNYIFQHIFVSQIQLILGRDTLEVEDLIDGVALNEVMLEM